jgi:hypothetical protein
MRIVVLLLLVVGCKEAAEDWVGKDAAKSVAKIKTAIAAHKPSDAFLDCVQMSNIDVLKAKFKDVAAELEPLCTHELPIATIEVAVVAAEAARKAKPNAEILGECYDPFAKTAVDDLVKYKTLDDKAKALIARMAAACPDAKLNSAPGTP